MWRSCVESNGSLFVVEGEHEDVIGFLCLSAPRDEDLVNATELTAIYLDSDYYGSGIGTAFWKEVEKKLLTDCVYLWVLSTNQLGIAFYEKNGFRPDGKIKNMKIGQEEFTEFRYQKRVSNSPSTETSSACAT